MTLERMETPSPANLLGAKGIGEAGAIGAPAAIACAVMAALRPLGVKHLDMPYTPAHIWQAIRDARTIVGAERGESLTETAEREGWPSPTGNPKPRTMPANT